MNGFGSIEVAWQFDNGVLSVIGTGKNLRIQKTEVLVVKYPARNKALIRFGKNGEHTLNLHFPNIKGFMHDQWGEFQEMETTTAHLFGSVCILLSAGIILLVCLVSFFYFLGMPWLMRRAVDFVPVEQEILLGREVANSVFTETPPDSIASARLNQFADAIDFNSAYPLHFNLVRDSTVNAFALPGGEIVVYSGIIEKLNHSGQLAALLSHEAAHVIHRHALHGVMDKVFWSALLSMVLGDGSLIAAIFEQGNQFRSLAYSRDLETQADTAGAGILRRNGIEVRQMLSLLEVLQQASAHGASVPEFLQTHPSPKARIEEIKTIAEAQKTSKAQPKLDSLFFLLKTELK